MRRRRRRRCSNTRGRLPARRLDSGIRRRVNGTRRRNIKLTCPPPHLWPLDWNLTGTMAGYAVVSWKNFLVAVVFFFFFQFKTGPSFLSAFWRRPRLFACVKNEPRPFQKSVSAGRGSAKPTRSCFRPNFSSFPLYHITGVNNDTIFAFKHPIPQTLNQHNYKKQISWWIIKASYNICITVLT